MQAASLSTRPLWRVLKPGKWNCGFQSLWQFDYGRTYNTVFADKTEYAQGKSPRPILLNIWYPTGGHAARTPMAYGDYLHILSADKRLAGFSAELAAFARSVIVSEVFHKEETALIPEEQACFHLLTRTDTAACRNAPAPEERFPCILYMAGSGSSFEDSSVLCEFLATHGYVVIGSAFQKVDGSSLSLQGTVRAGGDIRFLLSFAQSLPYVDWNHIGMVGHSLGAQAAIIYQTEPDCAVDATVSLDTTQDYHSLAEPNWKNMTEAVRASAARMTRPILFAANSNAGFEMADSMMAAPRYLYTSDALFHDDFITHGSLDRWAKLRLASEEEREAAHTEAILIWNRYRTLCETILNFLNATLTGDDSALNAQLAHDYARGFRGDLPHLEYVSPGVDGPTPYNASTSSTPTPRQIRQLLRNHGAAATVAALRGGWQPEPWSAHITRRWQYPVYDGWVLLSLLYPLLMEGKTEEAKMLYRCYCDIGRMSGWPEAYPAYSLLLKAMMHKSRTYLDFLLLLDPGNRDAVRELEQLETTGSSF